MASLSSAAPADAAPEAAAPVEAAPAEAAPEAAAPAAEDADADSEDSEAEDFATTQEPESAVEVGAPAAAPTSTPPSAALPVFGALHFRGSIEDIPPGSVARANFEEIFKSAFFSTIARDVPGLRFQDVTILDIHEHSIALVQTAQKILSGSIVVDYAVTTPVSGGHAMGTAELAAAVNAALRAAAADPTSVLSTEVGALVHMDPARGLSEG